MIPKRILQDQLAREPGRVLDSVGAGNPVVIEATGRPAAAIVDLVDYQILLAVIHYYTQHPPVDSEAEVLDTYWLDLRARFSRLGIPVRTGPVDVEGARQDALVAESLAS